MQHGVKANARLQQTFRHRAGHGAIHSGPAPSTHTVAEYRHQPAAAIVKDAGAVPAEGPVFGAVLGEAPAHVIGGPLAHLQAAGLSPIADTGRREHPPTGRADLSGEYRPVHPLLPLPGDFRLDGHPAKPVQAAADLQRFDAVFQQDFLHSGGGLLVKALILGKLPGHFLQDVCGGLEVLLHHLPDLGGPQLRGLLNQIPAVILVDLVPQLSGPAAPAGKTPW